jgi:hypothetical protein
VRAAAGPDDSPGDAGLCVCVKTQGLLDFSGFRVNLSPAGQAAVLSKEFKVSLVTELSDVRSQIAALKNKSEELRRYL